MIRKSIQDTQIVFIGAGNLATNLAKALYRQGFRISQVYSRTESNARELANAVEAEWTDALENVSKDGEIYFVCLTDTALIELLPKIVMNKNNNALFVHTAGSIPMDIWKGQAEYYGVVYPMQTFSKQIEVDFSEIPIFIEASDEEVHDKLKAIVLTLSKKIYDASSEQRKILHLAAVFTCNFTNHMYALAADLLNRYHLPFEVMLPLVDETARKVHQLPPVATQTGPAMRNDEDVMNGHLKLLKDEPEIKELYELISKSIHKMK
jgi:predicted short-subunit dehydrogenase-like oxidoreductase (DUF2520 family)